MCCSVSSSMCFAGRSAEKTMLRKNRTEQNIYSINYKDCYSAVVQREDLSRCKNVRSTGRQQDCVDTDTVHILQLKYFHKEITSCASLIPTVRSEPGHWFLVEHNTNHWTTAGYTLRCLLAQRLSPPSSPSPFYNFNFDPPDIHQRL